MSTKRKYRPGPAFRTVTALTVAAHRGEWIYVRHKPQHPRWILWMALQTVSEGVTSRIFRRAIPLALCLALAGCATIDAHRKEAGAMGAVIDFALGAAALATGDVIGAAASFTGGALTLGTAALEEANR